MRKRVYVALALLLVMLAGVSAWQGLRLREPVYEGKPLSLSLETLRKERANGNDHYARPVIRHIGTNALPVLIEWLHAQDTLLKQMMMTWAQKQKLVHFNFKSADQRRGEASHS
jgi:hypothetical protein